MYPQSPSLGALDFAEGVRLAIRRVYLWMAVGLFVTAAVAYVASTLPRALLGVLILPAIVLELVVVIGLSALINKLSPAVASLAFFFYAALNGITLSVIFLVYTGASIAFAFAATASMFAAMSIVGYTTKTDLTKFGSLLFMGLIGLLVASVINMFFASSVLYWIISFAGV